MSPAYMTMSMTRFSRRPRIMSAHDFETLCDVHDSFAEIHGSLAVSLRTLTRRVKYGGRKGRSAARRLRVIGWQP